MRSFKAMLLLLLFSFVLAHSAVPHHHHVKPEAKQHHHHDASHHDHDDDQEDDHNAFTFSQIDDIFINGKQLSVPIMITVTPTSSFIFVISEEDVIVEYVEEDIHRPPLICVPQNAFRGPPTLF